MKRLLLLTMAVAMIVALMPPAALADMPVTCTTDLIADGGTYYDDTGMWGVDVGEVQVWNDGENLHVTYVIDAQLDPDNVVPTLIYQTHLEVALSEAVIPQTNNGNPKIGLFTYNDEHDPGVQFYEYVIPLGDWMPGDVLFIAAHAIVKELGGVEGLVTLPDTVSLRVVYPGTDYGDPTYFDAFITNGGDLDGTYDSWCVDIGHYITPGATYNNVKVCSSYEDIPDYATIDKPENLDLVNYIINKYAAGDISSIWGAYTMCDIQRAIWTLIDNHITGCGEYDQNRVNEIVDDAVYYGEDFVPGCGEKVVVVLVEPPALPAVQVTIQVITIGVEVPCEDLSETAWGFGATFTDSTWAMYFNCTVHNNGD